MTQTPQRIVVSIRGGVAEIDDAENWPEGLELYIVDYDNDDPSDPDTCHVEGPCSIGLMARPTQDMTGHFAAKVAEAYRNDQKEDF